MDDIIMQIGDGLEPSQSKEVYTTLQKIFANIVKTPGEPKFRTLKKDNKKVAEILRHEAVKSLFLIVGFEDQGATYHFPTGQNLSDIQEAVDLLGSLADSYDVEEPAKEVASEVKPVAATGGRYIKDGVLGPATGEVVAPPAVAVPNAPSTASMDSNGAKKKDKPKSAFEFESRTEKENRQNQAAQGLEDLRKLQKEKYQGFQADPNAVQQAAYKPTSDNKDSKSDDNSWSSWLGFGGGGSSSGSGGGPSRRDDKPAPGGPRIKTVNDLPKPVRRGG